VRFFSSVRETFFFSFLERGNPKGKKKIMSGVQLDSITAGFKTKKKKKVIVKVGMVGDSQIG